LSGEVSSGNSLRRCVRMTSSSLRGGEWADGAPGQRICQRVDWK
jgi:hypothetical protein